MGSSRNDELVSLLPAGDWQAWDPNQAKVRSGIYVVLYELDQSRRVQVGRLGQHSFSAGRYLYVGSASAGLTSRLERHARAVKKLRWHIDYLSVQANFLGAYVLPNAEKSWECQVANSLHEQFSAPIEGFGASDCRCLSHLYFYESGL